MSDLHHLWTAVWPNLVANVVWVPLAGAYHLWTRRRFDALHDTIRELHRHLNGQGQHHSTELNVNTIDWGKVFKSPQAVVSLLVAVVTTAGTAGLIDTDLSGAIQTLLVAILGVISAVTHVAATAKITRRQELKKLSAGGDR